MGYRRANFREGRKNWDVLTKLLSKRRNFGRTWVVCKVPSTPA